ncbi:Nn.00g058950.m01.CDS01 [Neocucurbitaria sp. VM-36]
MTASKTVIRDITPNITTFTIPFNRFAPFGYREFVAVGNRATAIRLHDNRVLLLNPVPLETSIRAKLTSLGGVHFIACDLGHHLSVSDYVKVWPDAKTIGVPSLGRKRKDVRWAFLCGDWSTGGPEDEYGFTQDIETVTFEGFITYAVAWYHKPSKTLVQSDLMMNLPCTEQYRPSSAAQGILSREFAKRAHPRSVWFKRLIYYVAVVDYALMRRDAKRVAEWDIEWIPVAVATGIALYVADGETIALVDTGQSRSRLQVGLGGLGVGLQLESDLVDELTDELVDELTEAEELSKVDDDVAKMLVSWDVNDTDAVSRDEMLDEEARTAPESMDVKEANSEALEVVEEVAVKLVELVVTLGEPGIDSRAELEIETYAEIDAELEAELSLSGESVVMVETLEKALDELGLGVGVRDEEESICKVEDVCTRDDDANTVVDDEADDEMSEFDTEWVEVVTVEDAELERLELAVLLVESLEFAGDDATEVEARAVDVDSLNDDDAALH